MLEQKIFFPVEVTLLGRYYKPNGTLTPPPLSPPSSIIQTLPQMSSWCCHEKLRPIGCNQKMWQACPPLRAGHLYSPALFLLWSVQPSWAPCFIPHFCPHTLALSFFTQLTDYWLHCSGNLHLQLLVFPGFMTLLHVFITTINTPGPIVRCFNSQYRLGINIGSLAHKSSTHYIPA